jgi:sigma-B regulation protein RsbU (phosphoserine phosphatase)
MAVVPPRRDSLLLCSAGHNPAVIVQKRRVEMSTARGLALGILEDTEYEEERRSWSDGDLLILYSDGVTECTWHDEMYGEDRLRSLIAGLHAAELSASEIGNAILDDLRSFSHGHLESDDVTLVIVKGDSTRAADQPSRLTGAG